MNRFAGDLLDGREDRINPNFGVLLFVTNGVTSTYHAFTAEVRRELADGFSLQANYRWSQWLDTSSDTSTGQFQDNSEPGKGAQDASCLRCERAPSLFDMPHRFSASVIWAPRAFEDRAGSGSRGSPQGWQISSIVTAQSGRPFSVWNGAAFSAGGDYNADGGGGAVGGGFYDRPDAPAAGAIDSQLQPGGLPRTGCSPPALFPKPAPGANGTLGRNTFRGPRYVTLDVSLARTFGIGGARQLQLRVDVYNALNTLNLFLPNADLSLSNFGKSTQAFDARDDPGRRAGRVLTVALQGAHVMSRSVIDRSRLPSPSSPVSLALVRPSREPPDGRARRRSSHSIAWRRRRATRVGGDVARAPLGDAGGRRTSRATCAASRQMPHAAQPFADLVEAVLIAARCPVS